MAKRRDQHQARKAAVQALGKNLSRRARSECELCGDGGRLDVVEVEGHPDEDPSEDWALLLCTRCQDLKGASTDTLRFLERTIWSELRPAQIAAIRSLRTVDAPWAREALEGLWIDEELAAQLGD